MGNVGSWLLVERAMQFADGVSWGFASIKEGAAAVLLRLVEETTPTTSTININDSLCQNWWKIVIFWEIILSSNVIAHPVAEIVVPEQLSE